MNSDNALQAIMRHKSYQTTHINIARRWTPPSHAFRSRKFSEIASPEDVWRANGGLDLIFRRKSLPLVGLEQPSECSEKQQVERKEAQNTAQHRAGTEHAPDPDLAKLIDAWPSLPVETRQAILETVADCAGIKKGS